MQAFNFQQRHAGVLLHPTSLPSHTLNDAYRWLDFMAQCGLSVWQVLPLSVPQNGLSPYQSASAFAINPTLLASYPEVDEHEVNFQQFCLQQSHWLDNYALYLVLKNDFDQKPWYQWPTRYKGRDRQALEAVQRVQQKQLVAIQWQQYQLYDAWQSIRHYAHERGIHFFGDISIFVAHDSADVWADQQHYQLDNEGMPTVVTGVPPDYFSETGQRWGSPHYDWEKMAADGFSWWLARMRYQFEWFDLVRIDHFRGLEAVWEIDAGSDTAIKGKWKKTPGRALLTVLQEELDAPLLVAEDLGMITPEVTALKNDFQLPGMSVLQFAFDAFEDNPHKPKNIKANCVAYSGTHDNDTTLGWYRSLDADTQHYVQESLGILPSDENAVLDAILAAVMQSQAALSIIPLQDFLALGSEARMNTPGEQEGCWQWTFQWQQLEQAHLTTAISRMIKESRRVTIAWGEDPAHQDDK